MTPKQISALTLADIEAIAERLGNAARTIRDAQSLLGGGAVPPLHVGDPARRPVVEVAAAPVDPNPGGLTPAELAERERLLKLNRPEDYPPDIAEAMRNG